MPITEKPTLAVLPGTWAGCPLAMQSGFFSSVAVCRAPTFHLHPIIIPVQYHFSYHFTSFLSSSFAFSFFFCLGDQSSAFRNRQAHRTKAQTFTLIHTHTTDNHNQIPTAIVPYVQSSGKFTLRLSTLNRVTTQLSGTLPRSYDT